MKLFLPILMGTMIMNYSGAGNPSGPWKLVKVKYKEKILGIEHVKEKFMLRNIFQCGYFVAWSLNRC